MQQAPCAPSACGLMRAGQCAPVDARMGHAPVNQWPGPEQRQCAAAQAGKASRTTVLCTHGKPSLRENLLAVFGAKTAAALEPVGHEDDGFVITGFVSSAVKSGSKTNGDRQFFFLNGRPVELPKALRAVNDAYRCAKLTPWLLQSDEPDMFPQGARAKAARMP
jgi:DNA mismatch repair protein, C-terminal domain